jgi:hypothetical protein
MTLLNGQIPLKNHQSGHAARGNDGSGMKIFHSSFSTTWVFFPSGHFRHCAQS